MGNLRYSLLVWPNVYVICSGFARPFVDTTTNCVLLVVPIFDPYQVAKLWWQSVSSSACMAVVCPRIPLGQWQRRTWATRSLALLLATRLRAMCTCTGISGVIPSRPTTVASSLCASRRKLCKTGCAICCWRQSQTRHILSCSPLSLGTICVTLGISGNH